MLCAGLCLIQLLCIISPRKNEVPIRVSENKDTKQSPEIKKGNCLLKRIPSSACKKGKSGLVLSLRSWALACCFMTLRQLDTKFMKESDVGNGIDFSFITPAIA